MGLPLAHVPHIATDKRLTNRLCSRFGARVDHVFGYRENRLGGRLVRTIGLARTDVKIGPMNLTYKFKRYRVPIRSGATAPAFA